jgi:CHAT domain-containing protein
VSSYATSLSSLLRSRETKAAHTPFRPLIIEQSAPPNEHPIPNCEKEALQLRELLKQTLDVSPAMLQGSGATVAAATDALKECSWVHFACHGRQDAGNPLSASFVMHDGPLTIREITGLHTPDAHFAFLSACHSAQGAGAHPDEAMHLAASLQHSGFRGIVWTLWQASDDVSAELVQAFYREVLAGGEPDAVRAAECLARAVQGLREKRVPIHVWAPYIHVGI